MLGLADKSKIISLFKEVLSGNEKDALNLLSELINDGLDAKNFLNDILEVIYLFSRRINLGPIQKDMTISESEAQMIDEYSKKIDMLTNSKGTEFSPLSTNQGIVFLKTTAQHTSRPALLINGKVKLIGNRTKIFKNQRTPDVIEVTATDGNKFMATIFYPNNYDKRKKYPASIFLHGGSRRQMLQSYHYSGYYSNAFALQQYFASQGYMAMMINYRSGIGYGTKFREANNYGIEGASEVYDLIGAGEYLSSRSDIESNRKENWWGSYGGYLTAHFI